jgi:hypothetical protein
MARILRLAACTLLAASLSACAFARGDEPAGGGPDGGPGSTLPPSGGGTTHPCDVTVSLKLEVIAQAPDVLLALDRSSSMGKPSSPAGFDRKWDDLLEAINQVSLMLANRIYLGVMLVPSMNQNCSPGVIDIAPAPDSGKNLKQFLDSVWLGGGTPLGPSLQNARAYFASAPVNPHGRYVLLATDGVPNCDPENNATQLARTAITQLRQAGIRTFVIGYVVSGSDAAVLDTLAAAGGTGSHFPADSPFALAQRLEQITSDVTVVSCEYQLERGPERATDLTITIGGEEIPHDPDRNNGWDYNPATRMLTFHGDACDALRTSGTAGIGANYCGDVE